MLSMPYIVLTKGSKENNVTLGFSYNFGNAGQDSRISTNETIKSSESMVLNAAGTYRMSRRFAFMFEFWLLDPMMMTHDSPQIIGGPGIRYFRKINRVTARNGAGAKTWDLQVVSFPDGQGGTSFLPMFGASQRF